MLTIAFTGGGTGGHIYPALAIIERLRTIVAEPLRVFWIGNRAGMDASIVKAAGIGFYGIHCGKLRREINFRNFIDVFKVIAGYIEARKILKKESPSLLFSKGGFVSVPPCAAASGLKIPVWTHESDYSPGLATKINARFAERIFTAYKETAMFFAQSFKDKIVVTGNPVRPEFRHASAKRNAKKPALLVLGGSLGAKQLNELVRDNLAELTKLFSVIHQTGAQKWDRPNSENYHAIPYINAEMPQTIAAADIVLCRAGAGTLWECATVGRPMVLLPLQGSGTRGDQVENARKLEKAGAAIVLAPDGGNLLSVLIDLVNDIDKLEQMTDAAKEFARADAAETIAEEIKGKICQ
ncbi:MAG: undecaprenyldiphospho-muramoylpentapeptide beta-N-acetylglucosaminyltransferase [Spirochaetaceae bacterium]|jgi:UDP-N-acetylglucosamine--N-acetylmuramyl-(pentapeptide) pyrophosphoryl-undecaprenol N-acetylglucosamine transferase|nr:undecaprenyldiphospho-muramoylpentapeptide beta-N-acetylglucosaminyltransferase [Spirochaetaceae bacterium]